LNSSLLSFRPPPEMLSFGLLVMIFETILWVCESFKELVLLLEVPPFEPYSENRANFFAFSSRAPVACLLPPVLRWQPSSLSITAPKTDSFFSTSPTPSFISCQIGVFFLNISFLLNTSLFATFPTILVSSTKVFSPVLPLFLILPCAKG